MNKLLVGIAIAAITMSASSAYAAMGGGKPAMSQGEALTQCRNELGMRARSQEIRACVGRKMRGM